LPCRYANKIACFTKVYILSNISLVQQYESIQEEYPETWKALLRRINSIKKYSLTGIREYSCDEFINGFENIDKLNLSVIDM
jgi:hypothetical protein